MTSKTVGVVGGPLPGRAARPVRHGVLLEQCLGFVLAHCIGEAVVELLEGERDRAVAVGRVLERNGCRAER